MKSLRDVLPSGKRTVILRSHLSEDEQIKVDVRGIDTGDFGPLFSQFPEIYDALNDAKGTSTFIQALSARAVIALIAAGAECLGDKEAEDGIGNLALFEKMALLAPIIELTIPGGDARPFLVLVRAFGLAQPSPAEAEPQSRQAA